MSGKYLTLCCAFCGTSFQRRAGEVLRKRRRPPETQCCSVRCANRLREQETVSAEVYIRRLLGESRRNTNGKARGFHLTEAYLQAVWAAQQGRCAYTGVEFDLRRIKPRPMGAPSLDRIDSSKGYEENNVQFVCTAVNRMKHVRTHNEMSEFMAQIRAASVEGAGHAQP